MRPTRAGPRPPAQAPRGSAATGAPRSARSSPVDKRGSPPPPPPHQELQEPVLDVAPRRRRALADGAAAAGALDLPEQGHSAGARPRRRWSRLAPRAQKRPGLLGRDGGAGQRGGRPEGREGQLPPAPPNTAHDPASLPRLCLPSFPEASSGPATRAGAPPAQRHPAGPPSGGAAAPGRGSLTAAGRGPPGRPRPILRAPGRRAAAAERQRAPPGASDDAPRATSGSTAPGAGSCQWSAPRTRPAPPPHAGHAPGRRARTVRPGVGSRPRSPGLAAPLPSLPPRRPADPPAQSCTWARSRGRARSASPWQRVDSAR